MIVCRLVATSMSTLYRNGVSSYGQQARAQALARIGRTWLGQARWIVSLKERGSFDEDYKLNWEASLSFEKVLKYLPHFKSAIQIPIYVIGIDL